MNTRAILAAAIVATGLSACGGGGDTPPPAPKAHLVTLSWDANREGGVNSPGGGYQVTISGQPAPIDVPYNASTGVTPTTTTASLNGGTYTATVRAYAALDTAGGTSGSFSATSAPITIVVPQ